MQFLSHDIRDRVDRLCEWVFEPDYHRESATFRRERLVLGLSKGVIGDRCQVCWSYFVAACLGLG